MKEYVPETYKLGKAQKTGMKTVRVLQVLGGTSLGGAESRVMDSYRHMDRNRIQFDFAVHTGEKGFLTRKSSVWEGIYTVSPGSG